MGWLFVPESEGSNSDSRSPSESNTIGVFVTLSGKASQRPLSWRGWKTRPWIARLSGTTLLPSRASRGVESWISSLRATRVSRSPSQASGGGIPTHDTSGRTSSESLTKSSHPSSSSKTSPATSLSASEKSSPTYMNSDTAWRALVKSLRLDSSARKKSARLTSERDSSAWPTATAGDSGGSGSAGYPKTATRSQGTTLTDRAVRQWESAWPTPTSRDWKDGACGDNQNVPTNGLLGRKAARWATPTGSVINDGEEPANEVRRQQVLKALKKNGNGAGMPLTVQSTQWATPTASVANGGEPQDSRGKRDLRLDIARLNDSSRPARTSEISGVALSKTTRRLNPAFVEWLMGFPIGWTDSVHSEMESFLLWRRRHLSRLRELLVSQNNNEGQRNLF